MADVVDSIVDFVRIRQLNFAVLGVLGAAYFLCKYGRHIFKHPMYVDCPPDEDARPAKTPPCSEHNVHRSRSRSRGRHAKSRGRRAIRRCCPDCGLSQFEY